MLQIAFCLKISSSTFQLKCYFEHAAPLSGIAEGSNKFLAAIPLSLGNLFHKYLDFGVILASLSFEF